MYVSQLLIRVLGLCTATDGVAHCKLVSQATSLLVGLHMDCTVSYLVQPVLTYAWWERCLATDC